MSPKASRFPASARADLLRELRISLVGAPGLRDQFDALGELLATHVADYCIVDLVQSGELVRAGIYHADWSRRDRLGVVAKGTPRRLVPSVLAIHLLRVEAFIPRAALHKELRLDAFGETPRGAAVVPLRMFGEPAAVITVVVCRGAPFSKDDLAFLGEVAAWAALLTERTALETASKTPGRSFPPWPVALSVSPVISGFPAAKHAGLPAPKVSRISTPKRK